MLSFPYVSLFPSGTIYPIIIKLRFKEIIKDINIILSVLLNRDPVEPSIAVYDDRRGVSHSSSS